MGAASLQAGRLGPALLLTLSRAAQRNALDAPLLAALEAALSDAAQARHSAVVVTGEGGSFSAGMDLEAVAGLAAGQGTRGLHERFARVLDRLAALPGVTVALVDGDALGGGLALASACDVVIATDAARFGLPEALWGLLPANAAPVVARRAGLHAARRLALTAEPVDADEALRLGLVDYRGADRAAAHGVARRLCLRAERVGSEGLDAVKECFRQLENAPADYGSWALDTITAATDAPALRGRLAALPAADPER